jgi:hypothetical protein
MFSKRKWDSNSDMYYIAYRCYLHVVIDWRHATKGNRNRNNTRGYMDSLRSMQGSNVKSTANRKCGRRCR